MLIDKVIEGIRTPSYEISAKFHHDTKELLEHYKQLESKYPDRIYIKTKASNIIQSAVKKQRP